MLSYLLPFRWMLFFPVELLLGRLSLQEILIGFGAQIFWLALCLSLLRLHLERGR